MLEVKNETDLEHEQIYTLPSLGSLVACAPLENLSSSLDAVAEAQAQAEAALEAHGGSLEDMKAAAEAHLDEAGSSYEDLKNKMNGGAGSVVVSGVMMLGSVLVAATFVVARV